MTEAPEAHYVQTFGSKSDPKFIHSCVYTRILAESNVSGGNNRISAFLGTLPEDVKANCHFASDVASAATEAIINGNAFAHYSATLSLARLFDVSKNPDRDGIYATHEIEEYIRIEDLHMAIHTVFSEEWEKIEKLREELGADTIKNIRYASFRYVLEKDSVGLKAFLDQLPIKSSSSSSATATCRCAVCHPPFSLPSLEDVLLTTDKYGWTALHWAAELGSAECISVLLNATKRQGQPLFKKLLHALHDGNAPAVFISVYKGDMNSILAFLHGGADFMTTCGGKGVFILEYLVAMASSGGFEMTYFPILKKVLEYMKEKNPDLDLNAPIFLINEKEGEEEVAVSEAEGGAPEEEATAVGASPRHQGGIRGIRRDDYHDYSDYYGDRLSYHRRYRMPHGMMPFPRFDAYDYDDGEDDGDPDDFYESLRDMFVPGFGCGSEAPDDLMRFGWVAKYRRDLLISRYSLLDNENWKEAYWTLLSIPVTKSAFSVVKLLVDAGADPNCPVLPPSNNGSSSAAASGGQPFPILFSAFNFPFSENKWSLVASIAIMKLLIDAGVDVNAVDPRNKDTVMHRIGARASTADAGAAMVFLLKNGADPTIKNAKGKTPGDMVGRYNSELLELLGREVRLRQLADLFEREKENQKKNENTNAQGNCDSVNNNNNNTIDVDDEVPEDMQCGICWENARSITLAPCGHRRLCKGCALKILSRVEDERTCPFCKASIESYILQIYD